MRLNGVGLLAGVHAGREFVRQDNAQPGAVFQGAELFQGLGQLQARGRPGDKLMEEVALEAVDA